MVPAVPLVAALPSPPVRLLDFLRNWQFGDWTADVALLLQILAAVLYIGGVRRLAHRGRRWSPWRTVAFMAGLACLTFALVSGFAGYEDQVFAIHIGQHLIIMMLAPPLLALGAPVTLATQASQRRTQTRIVAVLHHPVVATLTHPLVAAALYYTSMYADTLSSFYPFSLRHPLVHAASHLVMFWVGCLFWWSILAVDEVPGRPGFGVRMVGLALGMPFEAFLGVSLISMRGTIAPEHTLADTHAGGGEFWVCAMFITFAAAVVLLLQWMRQEERKAARFDRRAARATVDADGTAVPSATASFFDPDEAAWRAEWLARTGRVPPTRSTRQPPEGAAPRETPR